MQHWSKIVNLVKLTRVVLINDYHTISYSSSSSKAPQLISITLSMNTNKRKKKKTRHESAMCPDFYPELAIEIEILN